jgi:uncharacterized SAM-binding protein YcdF (DUF218 family)
MRGLSRFRQLLGFGVVVLFVACAFTPMATVVAEVIGVSRQIGPADAIVVLAGGGVSSRGALSDTSLRRAIQGIDLYLERLAPVVVFSGDGLDKARAEGRIRAEVAHRFGVPREGILTISGARTTRDEAARAKSLLWPRGARTILLVTDADHMSRAAPVFRHVGFTVLPAPVNEPEWDLQPQGRLDLLGRTMRELVAVLYYRVAGYL